VNRCRKFDVDSPAYQTINNAHHTTALSQNSVKNSESALFVNNKTRGRLREEFKRLIFYRSKKSREKPITGAESYSS